jgi:hypothetical protein
MRLDAFLRFLPAASLALIAVSLWVSCAGSKSKPVPLQGQVRSPDGRLLEERVELNFKGKPEVVFQVYQDSAGNFIRHGHARHYYVNGQLKFEERYKDGRQDSITEFWYENGAKQGVLPFKDGKPHGLAVTWHHNGMKKSEKPWVDGKLHGLSREWDRKGKLVGETWWERNAKVTGPSVVPPPAADPADASATPVDSAAAPATPPNPAAPATP